MPFKDDELNALAQQHIIDAMDRAAERATLIIGSESEIETSEVILPELPSYAPDQLWINLAMSPSMRRHFVSDVYTDFSIKELNKRLDIMTGDLLEELADDNEPFIGGILKFFDGNTPTTFAKSEFMNLVHGATLAFEAIQIHSGHKLVDGVKGLEYDERTEKILMRTIPNKGFWGMNRAKQAFVSPQPPAHLRGIVRDVGQMAVYADRDQRQVRTGAWAFSEVLVQRWPEIYHPELPMYEPGRYADSTGGARGI